MRLSKMLQVPVTCRISRSHKVALAGLLVIASLFIPQHTYPQSPLNQRVLVVYADRDSESKRVAEYYLSKRNIPRQNLCSIKTWSFESDGSVSVAWRDLDGFVRRPIRNCLLKAGKDKILYIVFSYRTPYAISGVPKGAGIALDQFVEDIWDEAGGPQAVLNPYYAEIQSKRHVYPPFQSLAEYRASPGSKKIYSVWRLDGASADLARGLVDKAVAAEANGASGQACIDRRYGNDIEKLEDNSYESGDWDLYRAGEFLRDAGVPVTEDTNSAEFGTPPAPARCDGAIFYAGWYSLEHYNDAFTWNTGAIGIHLDSASASNPRGNKSWSANAIRRGITVTAGALDEPFLPGLPHPDGIVHDLLAGANVGDAFFRNTAQLKWMIINIGDPLYRPKFRAPTTFQLQNHVK